MPVGGHYDDGGTVAKIGSIAAETKHSSRLYNRRPRLPEGHHADEQNQKGPEDENCPQFASPAEPKMFHGDSI